jgi:hypothetical protein
LDEIFFLLTQLSHLKKWTEARGTRHPLEETDIDKSDETEIDEE